MTPAMASEPYCADAPSRSTSTLRTAAVGMVFRSTAEEPRPTVPLTFTRAAAWRRLLFTNTRVWSGARPRRVAGRMVSVPSASPGRGKLKEGRETASAWFSSGEPVRSSWATGMLSTGAGVSLRERPDTRVPVTTMASRVWVSSSASGVWAGAPDDWAKLGAGAARAAAIDRARRAGRVMRGLRVLALKKEKRPVRDTCQACMSCDGSEVGRSLR